MGSLFGPKCFLSSAFFIVTIVSIYGVVGSVFNYLQAAQVPKIGEWPFNIRPLYFSCILVQCLLSVAGFFAILAACKRFPIFLLGSASILLATFTCSTVFGIVGFRVSPKEILESHYKMFIKGGNDSKVLEWMNDMQLQDKCCGVYSYKDWYTLGLDNQITHSNIPWTCCRVDTLSETRNCLAGNFSSKATEDRIYTQGCGANQTTLKKETLDRLGIEMFICGMGSFVVAIFLYVGVTKFFLPAESSSRNHNGGNSFPTFSNSGGNGDGIHDTNNNMLPSGNSFYNRKKQRALDQRRKKRINDRSNSSVNGSIYTQPKGRSSRLMIRGNISRSKSFIIGDAPSNLLTPIHEENNPELLRKNVDMLWYQSLDKNMSTLSTTPNDISSMLLPAMIQHGKRHGLGYNELMAATPTNDEETFTHPHALYTLVSERPFTPNLSQNGSSSIVNYNGIRSLPPGMPIPEVVVGTGQSSPINSCSKQAPRCNISEEILLEESESCLTSSSNGSELTEQLQTAGKTDEQAAAGDSDANEEGLLITPVNSLNTSGHPTQPGSKYPNPTSSVRSSTLATIQEESESAKGSPVNAKGASPASECLTPETVSPQQTQIELCPSLNKDDNATTCGVEVNLTNNNNIKDFNLTNLITDMEPKSVT